MGRRAAGTAAECVRGPAQASSQSMPWLADLVQSSEGSLDVLPVQCLCEFLLHDAADDATSGEEEEEGESKEQKAKKRQVGALESPGLVWSRARLRRALSNPLTPTEAAEAAAAAGPPTGPAAGPQGRRADHVRGAGLLPAAPWLFPGGLQGAGHEGEAQGGPPPSNSAPRQGFVSVAPTGTLLTWAAA